MECEFLLLELVIDAGAVTFSDGIDETVLADELPKNLKIRKFTKADMSSLGSEN